MRGGTDEDVPIKERSCIQCDLLGYLWVSRGCRGVARARRRELVAVEFANCKCQTLEIKRLSRKLIRY